MTVIHPLVVQAADHMHTLQPYRLAGGWGAWYCPTCGARWRWFVTTTTAGAIGWIDDGQPRAVNPGTDQP